MKSARRVLSRIGVAGVAVAAALTVTVAAAGAAGADRVGGGYYTAGGACASAGQNYVDLGLARSYHCARVTSGPNTGKDHLILFT